MSDITWEARMDVSDEGADDTVYVGHGHQHYFTEFDHGALRVVDSVMRESEFVLSRTVLSAWERLRKHIEFHNRMITGLQHDAVIQHNEDERERVPLGRDER